MHLTLRDSNCPAALSVPLPRDAGSRRLPRAKPLVGVYTSWASRKLGAALLVDRPQPFVEICFLFVFSFPEYVFCLFFLPYPVVRLFFSLDIPGGIFKLAPGATAVRQRSLLVASGLACGQNAMSRPLPGAGITLPAQVSLSLSYFGGC